MTVDTVIRDCWIVNHDGRTQGGVAIEKGRIVAIGEDGTLPEARTVIEGAGNYLLPGAIDPHVHLGFSFPIEQDWRTESRSAAIGGVTSLIHFLWHPDSYIPHFDEDLAVAESNSLIDFAFQAMIVAKEQNQDIEELAKRGVCAFKWFTVFKGREGEPWGITACDDGTIFEGFERVARLGGKFSAKIHAENIELISKVRDGVLASGRADLEAWADSRPGYTEASDMWRAIHLAKQAGARLVIVHISSSEGVQVLSQASTALPAELLGETCPHYLSLTKTASAGVQGKVIPPIRSSSDQDDLWQAIREGLITSIGSDHAPTTLEEKRGTVWEAKQGFPGTAMILPIMLHEGVRIRNIPLETVVAVTAYNNARWYGLYPAKGSIEIGTDADLVLVDLNKTVTVTPELLQSNSDYCLHDGWDITGWPVMTMVRGRTVVDEGRVVGDPGWGKYLPVYAGPA